MFFPDTAGTEIIPRATLVQTLQNNRTRHAAVYAAAQDVYFARVRSRLNALILCAEKGVVLPLHEDTHAPLEYIAEYDATIAAFESTDACPNASGVVHLTSGEYRRYIQDQWPWSAVFHKSVAQYIEVDVSQSRPTQCNTPSVFTDVKVFSCDV